MKKFIPILLTLSMLTACRNSNVDDEMYNIAESVVITVDAYMDNKLSFDEAYEKIKGLDNQSDNWYDQHKDDPNNTDSVLTHFDISSLRFSLYDEHSGYGTHADLQEARDELADHIGY